MHNYKEACEIVEAKSILEKLMSLPGMYGFSLWHWQQSIHMMIEKVAGCPRIDKLQIIQLLEADFNVVLKIKVGRDMMKNTEKRQLLGDQMHGGRKGRGTSMDLMTEQLVNDITRQKRLCTITLNLATTK